MICSKYKQKIEIGEAVVLNGRDGKYDHPGDSCKTSKIKYWVVDKGIYENE